MGETTVTQSAQPFMGPAPLERAVGWLRGRERAVLTAAAGLQVAVLVAMIAVRAMPLVFGDTILLRVVPVDPRDLFRGDYVILSYDFSRRSPQGIEGLSQAGDSRDKAWQGRTVYVSLVPDADGRYWRADKVSISRPTSGRYIRGRIADSGQLEFGIEAYYVQEGTGREYEQAIRSRRLLAEVALTSDGMAALRGLRIE